MKTLYNGNHKYTEDARALNQEAFKQLKPLMDKYVAMGYSPREIAHIIIGAIVDIESSECM